MKLQDLLNTAGALRFGLWLGRVIPLRLGLALSDLITGFFVRRSDSPLLKTVSGNLRVVLGPDVPEEQVMRTTGAVFRNAGRMYFNFFHSVGKGTESVVDQVTFSSQTNYHLWERAEAGQGAVVVGAHLGPFDMAAVALSQMDIPVKVLAWADPTRGYQVQNELRSIAKVQWMTIGTKALRDAIRLLRNGGFAMTAVDRPVSIDREEQLLFFGRPTGMPVGHVRLALQTNVPVLVVAAEYFPDRNHVMVHIVKRVDMEHTGDKREDIRRNAQRILTIIESLIIARPEQWMMYFPVWEDVAD
ncbi:MAG: hypothetical protein U9R25_07225 [Chloroflexota bacterium]|nr:hypothetical protein [Chloroflexota bacterium]